MPVLRLKANELQDTDVSAVALVKRGANRIPFRITKGDNDMSLDLYKIGRALFVKQDTGPQIVAVLVNKAVDPEAVVRRMKVAGIDGAFKKTEDNGRVTFAKEDAEATENETFVLKLDDNLAVVVKASEEIVKAITTYDFESTSFREVMTKGSFVPSLGIAQEMLSRTFYNIMEKADGKSDLAKMITTACDEFKAYAATLAKGLPDSIFKFDSVLKADPILANPVAGNETPTQTGTKVTVPGQVDNDIEGNPAAGNETPTQTGSKVNLGTQAPSNDIEGNPAVKADASPAEPPKAEAGQAKKADEGAGDVMAAIAALTKSLTEGLAGVRSHVDASIATVKADVAKVSEGLAKAEEALSGTVIGDPEGDKPGRVSKGEHVNGEHIPLLDTAFMKVDGRGVR